MKKRNFLQLTAGIAGTAATAATLKSFDAPALAQNSTRAGLPNTYDGFLVGMGNGTFPRGELFIFGTPGIELFHKGVMMLTDAQVEAQRQEAMAFFTQKFRINLQNTADYLFTAFAVNPLLNYRVYVAAGEKVPNEGWIIRDGGWAVIVNNPNGITLDSGSHVPFGSMFVFGDYNILTTERERGSRVWGRGRQFREINISYRSFAPIIPTEDGSFYFRCDAFSVDFGPGQARGVSSPVFQNGLERANIRNVMTFNSEGGL
ncbi:hypothetical protein IQ243_01870 [Nostocales cyanobacterium LEGE 11386]|nr:hypothetical protein [Nostocales cyanobacterium LEGE 11386]